MNVTVDAIEISFLCAGCHLTTSIDARSREGFTAGDIHRIRCHHCHTEYDFNYTAQLALHATDPRPYFPDKYIVDVVDDRDFDTYWTTQVLGQEFHPGQEADPMQQWIFLTLPFTAQHMSISTSVTSVYHPLDLPRPYLAEEQVTIRVTVDANYNLVYQVQDNIS